MLFRHVLVEVKTAVDGAIPIGGRRLTNVISPFGNVEPFLLEKRFLPLILEYLQILLRPGFRLFLICMWGPYALESFIYTRTYVRTRNFLVTETT